jgi:putative ABC transport system permease protein
MTNWREPFRAAFGSLRAHKLRSALTTLGIVIGVASVVSVVHLMKSMEGRIMQDVNRQGSHTFFLQPWMPLSVWKKGLKVRWQPLDTEQIQDLREMIPEIQEASPSYTIWAANLKIGDRLQRTRLSAVDENGLDLMGMDLQYGRSFTAADRMIHAPLLVVGAKLAEDLDLTEASLGKMLTINGLTAELIGVLKKQGEVPFLPQDEEAANWGPDGQGYIPYGAFKELADPWTIQAMTWRLQVDDRVPVAKVEDLLRANLRSIRGLRGDDPENFRIDTNRKEVEQAEEISKALLMASGAMVSVSLLVGGIGVMNIMLVSVRERTREIGIRKAVGARRRTILVQFLVEATMLCVLGGIIGLVLGLSLGSILSHFLMKHMGAVPPWALASALLVPALVGLIFGLYPANKAAKLDPIESLRYE